MVCFVKPYCAGLPIFLLSIHVSFTKCMGVPVFSGFLHSVISVYISSSLHKYPE